MKFYPLAETINLAECKKLGIDPNKRPRFLHSVATTLNSGKVKVLAAPTGEKRPPKKGEWYLSGAEAAAYRATNDYLPSMIYQLARLVKVETIIQEIVVGV